jgi:molecular chaperone DnaK
VSVSARDIATNKSQTIQINPAGGLSKEEIDRLVREADEFSKSDSERRDLRRVKNRIEGLLYTNDKVFAQFRETLPEKDRKRASDALLKARMALSSDKRADLESALYDLNALSRKLSERMMAASGEAPPSISVVKDGEPEEPPEGAES